MKRHLMCLLAVVAVLSGCSVLQHEPVQPWQMDLMARGDMAAEPNPLRAGYRRHTQFSKEASTGGASADAGGCGCN